MKRGRGFGIAAVVLSVFLGLTGCARSGGSFEVAFVGDVESGEDQAVCAEVWQGVSAYASEGAATATSYSPETATVSGARNTMREAIEAGADVIVCVGDQMGNAVYDLQQTENHTQFVLLDGIPTDGTGKNAPRIRGNTYSVHSNREEAGYLAGYAAVYEGYVNIGFLGGSMERDDIRYGTGFIQGAEAAGLELGLQPGSITLQYGFITSNAISPSQVDALDAWFADGCELLCVSGNGPEFIGAESAARNDAVVITADMGYEEGGAVIAASGIDYAGVAMESLRALEEGTLPGGEETTFGAAQGCVSMKIAEGQLEKFSASAYKKIREQLANGEIEIAEDAGTPRICNIVER